MLKDPQLRHRVFAALGLLEQRFDKGQPRDHDGKWSDGAPGSSWREGATKAAEALEKLAGTPVTSTRPLGGGMSASTSLVDHEGGRLVHKKFPASDVIRDAGEQVDAEHLGSLVAGALGVRTPAVVKSGPRELRMEFMPGEPSAVGSPNGPSAELLDSDAGRAMGLLDMLIANADRNSGNWLLSRDGDPIAIDHGLSFVPTVQVGPFSKHFVNAAGDDFAKTNDMSPADMAAIRTRLESLRPEFEASGRKKWWDQMMQRFAPLEAAASGQRSRLT